MTLREFLHVLQRRKWIVLQTLILVVAVVVGISIRQQALYQSTSRVLLSWSNLANQLTNISPSGGVQQQPDRLAETQASVARTTAVAQRVIAAVPKTGLTAGRFLGESSVTPNPSADILIFTVKSRNPDLARRLVNEYALQYTEYRHELDIAAIVRARSSIKTALDNLSAQGKQGTQLYTDLLKNDQTLATMEALQSSNASVLQNAGGAAQIQPRTKRNAILAVVVGLVLGIAFAYLWETLDTSVRNAEDIRKHLGLPLLARLPPPPKRLDTDNRLVTLAAPDSPEAEAFRMLRTNLEFVMLGRGLQTIMVTSAIEQEGKSTTVSNLAVALARAGRRVVLIDLDLRRPRVDRFFKVDGPGVVQVALGHVDLDSALTPVDLPGSGVRANVQRSLNGDGGPGGSSLVRGTLHVLPAGAFPPDRSAFFESQALETILGLLRERADIVLVDAPPALQVGDAMALSRKVDGIIIVARVNRVRRPMLVELERLLAITPAQAIGFIATVGSSEAYETAYGGYAATLEEPESIEITGATR